MADLQLHPVQLEAGSSLGIHTLLVFEVGLFKEKRKRFLALEPPVYADF